jgi:1-deoxy-D-xylulose-5-phosphate synthase
MAISAGKEGKDRKVISVIGDGAITAGMAFEAMNHAGDVHPDMLVILNDNEMSISENVGALNNHLAQVLSGSLYTSIREGGKKVLSGVPPIKELVRRTEEHLKGMVVPGTLFEEFGFNYIGPVDGHDVNELVKTLKNMRELKGPQFLHIMSKKGKGYEPAEKDPIGYHGVPKFDPSHSSLPKSSGGKPSFSKIFGDFLCDMAAQDPKLMAITPAMREGSGMVRFSKEYPEQYFDVAIAEQHAVTLATGMAIAGNNPIVAIYSTFLQRGYDQLIHDVAIMNLPVMFAIDRAGLVGADGQTHQGAFDLSFMRCIPNMVIMAPSDENECRQMLYTGHKHNGPSAVRYPRGTGMGTEIEQEFTALEIGKGRIVRKGEKVAILSFGTFLANALQAADTLNATVADMRFVKPLDEALIRQLVAEHDVIVTLEENAIAGGAGAGVIEFMMQEKLLKPVLNLGLPDQFIAQGTQEELHEELGLDAKGIEASIRQYMQK